MTATQRAIVRAHRAAWRDGLNCVDAVDLMCERWPMLTVVATFAMLAEAVFEHGTAYEQYYWNTRTTTGFN